jgi:hypothetical protein
MKKGQRRSQQNGRAAKIKENFVAVKSFAFACGDYDCASHFSVSPMISYMSAASSFLTLSRSSLTAKVKSNPAKEMFTTSPVLSCTPGFAVLPFTLTLPPAHASLATVRRLRILLTFRNLSSLISFFLRVVVGFQLYAAQLFSARIDFNIYPNLFQSKWGRRGLVAVRQKNAVFSAFKNEKIFIYFFMKNFTKNGLTIDFCLSKMT